MPTSPEPPTSWLNRFQAGRCSDPGSRAKRSRSSNERQYWTSAGPPNRKPYSACRKPDCGLALSSLTIGRMAMKTRNERRAFHGRLNRMPMRKTTKSSSSRAVRRPGKMAMGRTLAGPAPLTPVNRAGAGAPGTGRCGPRKRVCRDLVLRRLALLDLVLELRHDVRVAQRRHVAELAALGA